MKLIFAGTPEFAAHALAALIAAGHHIELVLTQPDRPSGRGMNLRASPVKQLAEKVGIAVFQPLSLKDPETQEQLKAYPVDAMVVAAYGLILPPAVLAMPRFGCLNIHASLLPRWRGAAPIQRAILAGDEQTGVCIMQMNAGLDTGPVLHSAALPIDAKDSAASLHDKLAALGAQLIVESLAQWPLPAKEQACVGVTYADKITKDDAKIDWSRSAEYLARQVRAFNPSPGASCELARMHLKIWQAEAQKISTSAVCKQTHGQILQADKTGILVACAEGALRIFEVQKAGGKRLSAAQFLAGNAIALG